MDFWLGLIAGLIIGWVIEWIIDWRFWRSDARASSQEDTQLQRELSDARREIAALQSQLDTSPAQVPDPSLDSPEEASEEVSEEASDALGNIAGIDAEIAARLSQSGIRTFADLAATSRESLQTLADAEGWQGADVASWISTAQQLALADPKADSDAG